ncbi:MAG TPA: glycosyltransferase family 4 protein [Nitrososphaeraceae archaeon]|nr:glycosyltransferase family 4 protein [Nitrososphaeraceae archaeon]
MNNFPSSKKIEVTNDKNILLVSSSALSSQKLRILMVSPEYPPINGGVGRYTYNLVKELERQGLEVHVACDSRGNGDYTGLSPNNIHNSELLLKLVNEIKPDIIHIQYEPGLYGLVLHPFRPNSIHSTIDLFYYKCKIPIVTTFHSEYNFRQWMKIPQIKINKKKSLSVHVKSTDDKKYNLQSIVKDKLDNIRIYWKYLINYKAFRNQNKDKMGKSKASIVFSDYMKTVVSAQSGYNEYNGKVKLLYHGSEPVSSVDGISKHDARTRFPLLRQNDIKRIALAFGFMTVAKGWDMIEKMKVPNNWTIVINSSVNHTTGERIRLDNLTSIKGVNRDRRKINLSQDYLSEEDLSALFLASDAVLLPYRVTSGSGVMFDALGHGIPFIASDLPFFNEFASKGLGITTKRTPNAFTEALVELDSNYAIYKKAVEEFKENLKWSTVARNHIELYNSIINSTRVVTRVKARATVTTANGLADVTSGVH